VGSRERRRADRRKRKERSAERRAELAARREASAARTEAKNRAAREQLEPLGEDERPGVVTAAAVISGALAVGTILAYAIGVEVGEFDDFGNQTGESRPSIFPTLVSTAILAGMAYGLWRARYWAVLGFQTLLVLVIVVASLGLAQVTDLWRALAFAAILTLAGLLFYRMIKAMARIQMPERRPPAA
jgi:hypothetical protein